MISLPKQLVVIGDSSVYGWGDNEGGGWCERLRKDWGNNQNGPVTVSYTHLTLPTKRIV